MHLDNAIRLIWLLVFAAIVVVGAQAVSQYIGDPWIYGLFTLLSSAVLYFGFGPRAIFFDAFIGVLLWIGFWLKFSIRTAFFNGRFNIAVGAFDGSPAALDQTLLVVSCALAAILLARFLRQCLFNYPTSLPGIAYTGLFAFYRQYRVALLLSFVAGVMAVCAANYWLGIYQRGQVPRTNLPFGLNGVFAWLLMFGMATVSATLLRFEFELNRHRYWIVLGIALLETALSNLSMWSRGMILNGSSLVYGVLAQFRRSEARVSLRLISFLTLGFVVFFVGSVLAVNYFRAKTFYADSPLARQEAVVEQTVVLFLDRWVGVEGVMSVVGAPDKGWPVFEEALEEKFDRRVNSFYDQHFIDTAYDNTASDGLHFVSLPGYIAFLYYPGSMIFLFAAVFAFSAVAALFEYFVYRTGGRNLVLCALIAQVIAFRYTSFGYVPMQSYMLFGSIVLNVLILFFFDRLLRFFHTSENRRD